MFLEIDCKFCGSQMQENGRDRVDYPYYKRMYICHNCHSVYEQSENIKGEIINAKCVWFKGEIKKE